MTQKNEGPLLGYVGQEPTIKLADGRELSAGDVVAEGFKVFQEAGEADGMEWTREQWNSLEDDARRTWCEDAVAQLNEVIRNAGLVADSANVMDAVGTIAERQLGHDLIQAALEQIKRLERPWQAMNQEQQQRVLDRLTDGVRDAVRETVQTLATRGHQHVVCELEQFTVKKGAKATLTIPKGSVSEELLDAVGQPVILVVAASLDEPAAIKAPRAEPDQGDLLSQTAQGSEGTGGAGVIHSDPED